GKKCFRQGRNKKGPGKNVRRHSYQRHGSSVARHERQYFSSPVDYFERKRRMRATAPAPDATSTKVVGSGTRTAVPANAGAEKTATTAAIMRVETRALFMALSPLADRAGGGLGPYFYPVWLYRVKQNLAPSAFPAQ